MFEALTSRLGGVFTQLRGKGRLGESDVDGALREVRLALLEADVNLDVTKNLLARMRDRAVGGDIDRRHRIHLLSHPHITAHIERSQGAPIAGSSCLHQRPVDPHKRLKRHQVIPPPLSRGVPLGRETSR